MDNHKANIYASSMLKVTKKLEVYGSGDISDVNLLKLCYKYACYSDDYETLKKIDKIVAELQMKGGDVCMDVSKYNLVPGDGTSPVEAIPATNTAPIIDDSTVILQEDDNSYTFTLADFTNNYNDTEGNGVGRIVLQNITSVGELYYDGDFAVPGMEIYDPSLLVYYREQPTSYNDSLNFTIFDDDANSPQESALVTINIQVLDAGNLPPEVGDNTIYVTNRVTTVLTLEMFTSQLQPPYNDPEGDLIDAIRIDEVSEANLGTFLYNGIPVVAGDIITREDINAGLFTHDAADQDAVSSDVINFSARDEGSLIWVQ